MTTNDKNMNENKVIMRLISKVSSWYGGTCLGSDGVASARAIFCSILREV